MKTRYKIISILVILVVSFFVWPIPYNGICMLNNYDSCGTISGLDIPGIGFLRYDSIITGNPSGCWYQDDDGDMMPCMKSGEIFGSSESLNSLPKSLDTTICKNAISNLVDVSSRINPIPEHVARSMNISSIPKDMAIKMNLIPGDVITEELLKQKNNATLAALNNCDVESLTMEEIGQLLSWGKENE